MLTLRTRRWSRSWGMAGVLFCGLTCSGVDNFEVAQSASAVVPGKTLLSELAGDVGFDAFSQFDLAQSEEFANQGVKKKDVDAVHLKTLSLKVTDTSLGQTLDFLDSIVFFVEAPGEEKRELAHGGPFPGATEGELTVEDFDLVAYVTADSMSLTAQVTGHSPDEETTLEASVVLDVDANVSGVLCGK